MTELSHGAQLIVAKNVHKVFSGAEGATATKALDGISLSVAPNEFVAIVGSSGSGKSTLLYCLSGLEQSTSGDVELLGAPLAFDGESATLTSRQAQGIGFVFQNYQLLKFLTVSENIMLPAKYSGTYAQAIARLPEMLERLGLAEKATAKIAELSGGQQQRVAIARALINESSIIFADEPTGALDTKNAHEVAAILETIPNEQRSVVMVTHDLEMAARASRILILSDGKILSELGKSTATEILAAMRAHKNKKEIA